MKFSRQLASVERLFVVYHDLRPPFVIQWVVEGEGDLAQDQLERALEITTEANPGSALCLHGVGGDRFWGSGPTPRLVVDQSEEELDPYRGPTAEVVVAEGRLVFRALHAVMDGLGVLSWAKDFMRALRGEPLLGHASPLTADQLMEQVGLPERPLPPVDALHPFGRTTKKGEGSSSCRVQVDRPLSPYMLPRIAVRLAERARRQGEGPVRFNIPTDLRHYANQERSTGNLLGTLVVDLEEGTTAESLGLSLVRAVYEKQGARPLALYRQIANLPLTVIRYGVQGAFAAEHETGRYLFSATLSHLGQQRGSTFSAPGFSAQTGYFIPPFADWVCYLSLNGFDEHVQATVALPEPFSHALSELEDLVREVLESPAISSS